MTSEQLVNIIREEIEETKGIDLVTLDLRSLVSYTDYFVLVTGSSDRHVKAMADRIHLKLKNEHQRLPLTFEGYESAQWILLDYADVVVHFFLEETRKYYDLEGFWKTAPRVT